MNDEHLQRFLDRLVDREAVDWDAAERVLPQRAVRALRRIDSIASAYRRVAPVGDARRFGRLALLERIGGGFGGEIWRAHDPLLDRIVALKLDDGMADSARQARLLEEARTLARIDHPNVVRVLGADVVGTRVGIWSEYVEGEDLAARVRRDGRFGAEEARAIGSALCGALAAVHAAGFVHGDVKPQNVLRTRDGRFVLCDLGSALALRGRLASRPLSSGSPLYLAPEVLAGAVPGIASDLYALGATLFHLLSGVPPVAGDHVGDLAAAHREGGRAHLRDRRADLPPALVGAIEQALAADPSARPDSAGALEALLAQRPRPPRMFRIPLAAAASAAAVAIVAASWMALRPATPFAIADDVRWLRGDGSLLHDGSVVRTGDLLHVEFRCARACWAVVLGEDATHEIATLHPASSSRLPAFAADAPLRLPGAAAGVERDWRVGPPRGPAERLLLVVAPHAIDPADLDGPPDAASAERFRGIDGVVPAKPASGLAAIAGRLRAAGTLDVHLLVLRRDDAGGGQDPDA